MSSRGVGTKPMLDTKDNSGRIARARLERECKPCGDSTLKGPPMPGIYTVQGPWKILYVREASFTRSILVQIDFIEFEPEIGFPDLQRHNPDRYDIGIYWQDIDDDSERGVLPANSEELIVHWLDGPILAPKHVGKFKLMFKISRKGTHLTRRGVEAFDFAEEPLEAGHLQEGPKQGYVEVLDEPRWQRLARTRRDQPQEHDLIPRFRQQLQRRIEAANAVAGPSTVLDPDAV